MMVAVSTDRRKSGSRRVVLVGPDRFWQWMVLDSLAKDDEVTCCPGPEFVPGGCPLLAGQGCPLVEDADVIVTGLDSSQPINRSLRSALQGAYPRKPVIARAPSRYER